MNLNLRRQGHLKLLLLITAALASVPVFASDERTQTDICTHDRDCSIYSDNMLANLVQNTTEQAGPSAVPPLVYRPPQVPLDVKRYPIAPQGLKLEQVHVFVRHGKPTAGCLPAL